MNSFYDGLSKKKKISLSHSMRFLTLDFMESYNNQLTTHDNQDEILNDLYFYWLRNSAIKNYLWCEDLGSEAFSIGFSNEMKNSIKDSFKKTMNDFLSDK